MDDMWKDLSLSSLTHHTVAAGSSSISAAQPPVSGLDFQDFLPGPLKQTHRSESDEHKSCSSSTVSKPQCIKTRAASGSCSDGNAVDRKRIRLMKNRESATRSRARKQAYTYELELEVERLSKENSMLKQQRQQESKYDAAGDERPKKNKLHRTLTAPF